MTSPISHCETFADRLADFLEHDVDESTRAAMEAHARSCDDCGPLLADLRSLRIEAANLPELTPSRDLWAGIAQRIQADVIELAPAGARAGSGGWKGHRERRIAPVWFGLAAAGLVAITATVTHEMTKHSLSSGAVAAVPIAAAPAPETALVAPGTTTAGAAVAPATARSGGGATPAASTRLVSSPKPDAQQTYDAEIARLRVVVNKRRGQLDSTTVATIEKNLVIIDDAIAQCKQALRKDPASRFLMESLNDAMDTKVQLLRTAASLPSRM